MDRLRPFSIAFSAALLASACLSMHSQAIKQASVTPSAPKEKTLPNPPRLKPYFSDSADPRRSHSIEFRGASQMTEPDRLQAANAESSIAEHAKYANLQFNQGQWRYEQILCPALPNHIFLRFQRNNGSGDVSLFTASIPRGGEGRVRIIPLQRRGYSLFSPAPINALTISAFNHIRAEEIPDSGEAPENDPDWLGTGLCYAALAGGHPQAASISVHPENEKFPPANVALLDRENEGGAVLSFTDVSEPSRPMRWSMTFDRKGRLIKGGHAPEELLKVSTDHPLPVDVIGKPEPITAPTAKTNNPPAPVAVTLHPQPPPPPRTTTPPTAPNPVATQ